MTTQKFSQIALSPANLATTDFLVGVTAGNVDYRFTPAQLQGTVARTRLAANTTYYVRTTGNNSNDGLTPATAWLTTQHAEDFISANVDFAGFTITVDVGAGSFAGFGAKSTTGGGILQWQGAGSGLTTLTDGPNDGLFNFGEAICVNASTGGTVYGVNGFTLTSASSDIIDINAPYTNFNLANATTFAGTDIVFGACASGFFPIFVENFSSFFANSIIWNSGGQNVSAFCFAEKNSNVSNLQVTVNGAPTVSPDAFLTMQTETICSFISVTGAFTGTQAILLSASTVTSPTFGAGSGSGISVDATSSFDSIPGPLPGINTQTGTPYVLALGDAALIVEMNNAGANTLTVPANATVAFPIGTRIKVVQTGAGATTIAGAVGVTVHNAGTLAAQWAEALLYQRAANEWVQTVG